MNFIVGTPAHEQIYTLTAFLIPDGWDDWFTYSSLYRLVVFDMNGLRYDAGEVKIGEKHLKKGKPNIPTSFTRLENNFFSLGQNENYYEVISSMPSELKTDILIALRDCANDLNIFEENLQEDMMRISLLRFVSENRVRSKFNNIINGYSGLTDFNFSYQFPQNNDGSEPISLEFKVQPCVTLPTNIHVIIGRNGVGKTRMFRNMTLALKGDNPQEVGVFNVVTSNGVNTSFSNLISVSFSAFDSFEPLPDGELGKMNIKYNYIGIQRSAKKNQEDNSLIKQPPKTPNELTDEFVESLLKCASFPRSERWKEAINLLSADQLFSDASVKDLINCDREKITKIFHRLSSGHKIVLLTITRLVELVDEKTLVFLDEPESHLHPPLFAAFTRALSYLLTKRNGVAVIATHSPVVLQETPKNCVWIISRFGNTISKARPTIETFGENVGVLTREVFGLEVTHSGFHRLLSEEIDKVDSYEELLNKFNGSLGAEALSIAQAMLYYKKEQHEEA